MIAQEQMPSGTSLGRGPPEMFAVFHSEESDCPGNRELLGSLGDAVT